MSTILSLLIAALTAMAVAAATPRRPMICCPAAGVTAGVLLTLAGELAVAGHYLYAAAALLPGTTAAAWGLWHTFVQASRPDHATDWWEETRGRHEPVTSAQHRHDMFAESVAGEVTVTEWRELADRYRAATDVQMRRAIWAEADAMAPHLPDHEVALLFGRVTRGHERAEAALRELTGGAR